MHHSIERAGFGAVYVSGYATAAARHALPDIGLIGGAEMMDSVAAIRAATTLPLIADADTGYGDVNNVRHTVRRLEALDVAAIQIEDQDWPKRCGHSTASTSCRRRSWSASSRPRSRAVRRR